MNLHRHMTSLLASLAIIGLTHPLTADEPTTGKSEGAPPAITIQIVETTVRKDSSILLRVEIHNKGATPYRMALCPHRKLCCVKDMFALVEFDDTGMGLRDTSDKEPQETCEVYLVAGAIYSFPMEMAADRLPKECRTKPGVPIDFKLGFLADSGEPLYSNTVKIAFAD